jgi:hypothetical protein
MRNKIIVSLLSIIILLAVSTASSYASTSIRLQTPSNQTNQDTMNLTFVALDTIPTQTVAVDCYKKGPSDATYTVFQSFSLPNGGNTDNCNASFNQGNGTYNFYATANGSGNATTESTPVSVTRNTDKPGNPYNYSKSKPDDCTYKITFRTADDSGKTVKVVLYRSSDTNFSLDNGHKVNEVNLGSNTDGSMTDNISPNCSTNYYYAIRSFDTYGNGSDGVGDSTTSTVTVNPTGTAQGLQGAIPVNENNVAPKNKEVLGTESAKETNEKETTVNTNPISASINWIVTHKTIDLIILVLLAAIAYYWYRKNYKKTK